MMATTTNREAEVDLTLKAADADSEFTDRDLQELIWHRDQKLNARLLAQTPTEDGEGVTQA